jgi:Zn-dependent protease
MPSLRFSQRGLNLVTLLDINFAQIVIAFIVLLFSLTVHESAHAWTADRLGDPTARLLGRVSLNPMVHADPIGTILFPLLALVSGVPLIGWAKPVPVNVRRLRHQRRDYVLVAAAGPASNLVLAVVAALLLSALPVAPVVLGEPNVSAPLASLLSLGVQLNLLLAVFNMLPIPPLDGGNVLSGLLPMSLALRFDQIRPYGFLLLYALMFTNGFQYLVLQPYNFLRSWLP